MQVKLKCKLLEGWTEILIFVQPCRCSLLQHKNLLFLCLQLQQQRKWWWLMMKMMKKRWGYVISLYEILHCIVNHITKMSFFVGGEGVGGWRGNHPVQLRVQGGNHCNPAQSTSKAPITLIISAELPWHTFLLLCFSCSTRLGKFESWSESRKTERNVNSKIKMNFPSQYLLNHL